MSLKNFLYYTFFGSFNKEHRREKEGIWEQYREVKSELEQVQSKLEFEQNRFRRLKYLTKDRRDRIVRTKHGSHVWLKQEMDHKRYHCVIYDLDDVDVLDSSELDILASENMEGYFINGIEGGNGRGHGEIAMNLFFQHIERRKEQRIAEGLNNALRIWGELSPLDEN